jgi:hypothetical protein
VKVTPSQQLILASDAGTRSTSGSVLLGLTAAGAVAKRITLVASRSDATLVLFQDDVSSGAGAASDALPVRAHYFEPDEPLSLHPAELYARTQASFGDALKGTHIDVLA